MRLISIVTLLKYSIGLDEYEPIFLRLLEGCDKRLELGYKNDCLDKGVYLDTPGNNLEYAHDYVRSHYAVCF